jgi:hypothetical protein
MSSVHITITPRCCVVVQREMKMQITAEPVQIIIPSSPAWQEAGLMSLASWVWDETSELHPIGYMSAQISPQKMRLLVNFRRHSPTAL